MNHHDNANIADAAFVPAPGDDDVPDFSPPVLPPIDRSTAEPYSVCPRQGRLLETGNVMVANHAINVGDAVHVALSRATTEYIKSAADSQTYMGHHDLAEFVKSCLMESRPDVQADALAAMVPSINAWSRTIAGDDRNPKYPGIAADNILHYDGGVGERSGQLGIPFDHLGIMATSEVDLLVATDSPTLLREYDWKSGRTDWTEQMVAASFQFNLHAVLVFYRYKSAEALDVSILLSRWNEWTEPVRFKRERLPQYAAMVERVYAERAKWSGKAPGVTEAWPGIEKCGRCPAAMHCDVLPPETCAKDPIAYVTALINLDRRMNYMRDRIAEYVDEFGDIIHPDGYGVGRNKPPERRKKPVTIYQVEPMAKENESVN